MSTQKTGRRRLVDAILKRVALHRCFSPLYSGLGTIVLLHRVVGEESRARAGNSDIEVSPELLEQLLDLFLDRGYEIVSLDRLHAALLGHDRPSRRLACFTFDDGYVDNYRMAYPIFSRRGLPFAIYVTTSMPDRTAVLWWYPLEELVLAHDTLAFAFEGASHRYRLDTLGQKREAFESLRRLVIASPGEPRERLLDAIFGSRAWEDRARTAKLALDWEMIEVMSRDESVTIGAHTVNHIALNQLDEATLRREVLTSRQRIEERIGRPVEHFAYPFGSRIAVGAREFRLVKGMGFKTATTTRAANVFAAHRDHLECLPRIAIWGHDGSAFDADLALSGLLPAVRHGFRRVITC